MFGANWFGAPYFGQGYAGLVGPIIFLPYAGIPDYVVLIPADDLVVLVPVDDDSVKV